MELVCCMNWCKNSRLNSSNLAFLPFPTNFENCLKWVQACGKADLIEEFAFGGAFPFLNRRLCEKHFEINDFFDPDSKQLGVKVGAAPTPYITALNVDIPLTPIKIDGSQQSYQRTKRIMKASSNSLRAKQMAKTRRNECEEKRKNRLYKNAVQAAIRRSLETEEEQKQRKLKNALRSAFRRATETAEQREIRRQKDLLRSAKRRARETEYESTLRKYNDAVRAAFRRQNETEEQRKQRQKVDVVRAAKRRSSETPEQRTVRLKADRERATTRRNFQRANQYFVEHIDGSPMASSESLSSIEDDRNFREIGDESSNIFVEIPNEQHFKNDIDCVKQEVELQADYLNFDINTLIAIKVEPNIENSDAKDLLQLSNDRCF